MLWLADALEAIRDFMTLGGPVLRAIAVTIFVMWVLIVERIIFFRSSMKQMSREIHDKWESRPERQSWNAKQIRELMISRFSEAANRGINVCVMFSISPFSAGTVKISPLASNNALFPVGDISYQLILVFTFFIYGSVFGKSP